MSRYTGPRLRVMRALNVELPGLSRKSPYRKPYPPGEHGAKRRRADSVYGVQLKEKQKLKMNYGVTESQMRRLVKQARKSKIAAGVRVLELLESRMDNAVFRAGFASSIPAARQLVNHGHFMLNGRKTDVPSAQVKAGDSIQVRQRSFNLAVLTESLAQPSLYLPDWITLDMEKKQATVTSAPTAESVPFLIDVQQVIEYYNTRI